MPLAIGQLLEDRYRILGLLGQGGMGAVYLAEHTLLTGRRFAIKENVPGPNANPQTLAQLRQQFLAEASILSLLDHPSLTKVSDYFTQANNEYLVMDYVEGENLQSVLDQTLQKTGRPLPERVVLPWINQVLDALEYLHTQQPYPIIHRDIKPANIILTAQGKVKLVDFGLVKVLDPLRPGTATVVKGFGTPEYAALEQHAQGATGHTDARTDIYALGATLYHLLTGAAPPDALRLAVNPASLTRPRQANPALSAAGEAAILRAMALRPDQRFQTARDMRQALPGAGSGGQPPPSSAKSRVPGWVVGAIAGAVLATMIFLVVQALGPRPQTPATPVPPRAEEPTQLSTLLPSNTTAPPSNTPVPSADTPTPVLDIGSTLVSKEDRMEMVYVPGGEFLMGSPDSEGFNNEHPQHTVYLDAYWIDKTEVTAVQYRGCVDAGFCSAPHTGSNCTYDAGGKSDHPINCVDWTQALAYCASVSRRLPTEAQWEKAARGTNGRVYPWGDTWDVGKLNSYLDLVTSPVTLPVGSYPAGASPYGALDIAGNVAEWVADWYDAAYYASSPRENPVGPGTGSTRVVRGGSYPDRKDYVRAAVRSEHNPDDASSFIGFRCARSS